MRQSTRLRGLLRSCCKPDDRQVQPCSVLERPNSMKFLLVLLAFALLMAIAWPLALLVLLLAPLVWLVALPFRLLGACVEAVFALVKALLFLPARILGYRS